MLIDKRHPGNLQRNNSGNQASVFNGKYEPLQKWFLDQPKETGIIHISFKEIERVIGQKLPYSARTYPAWWANGDNSHYHAKSWLDAGWKVESVNFDGEVVSFRFF
ncbi:MAG: hypothetical protein J0I20_11760 [Chloroflexi bacterium]|nr:hypothetical protein [Chloroflexota bacterium]OJV92409.1 MAG: hypothetical protein BGO39_31280 [Chloroflexi bacterium 54-19]